MKCQIKDILEEEYEQAPDTLVNKVFFIGGETSWILETYQ